MIQKSKNFASTFISLHTHGKTHPSHVVLGLPLLARHCYFLQFAVNSEPNHQSGELLFGQPVERLMNLFHQFNMHSHDHW